MTIAVALSASTRKSTKEINNNNIETSDESDDVDDILKMILDEECMSMVTSSESESDESRSKNDVKPILNYLKVMNAAPPCLKVDAVLDIAEEAYSELRGSIWMPVELIDVGKCAQMQLEKLKPESPMLENKDENLSMTMSEDECNTLGEIDTEVKKSLNLVEVLAKCTRQIPSSFEYEFMISMTSAITDDANAYMKREIREALGNFLICIKTSYGRNMKV